MTKTNKKITIVILSIVLTVMIGIMSPNIFADQEKTGNLVGNFFTIYEEKEHMIPGLTVTVTSYDAINDEIGKQVATTKTDQDGNFKFENLPVGFYIVGIGENSGYFPSIDDESDFDIYGGVFAFVRNNEDSTFTKTDGTIYLEAEDIQIAKLIKNSTQYLKNAKLKITTKSDLSLESVYGDWTYHKKDNSLTITTKEDISSIYALPIGKYQLEEIEAPEGYQIAKNVSFEINEDYDIIGDTVLKQTVRMYDEKINTYDIQIIKKDEDDKILEGAKMQLLDENEKVIKEWTSSKEPKTIKNLNPGKYTIKEIEAPNGYLIADPQEITLKSDGTSKLEYTIIDEYTKTRIAKYNTETNTYLEGAVLQLLNDKKEVVDEWTSTNKNHIIDKLSVNKIYYIHEKEAPKGYSKTEDIKIVVPETNKPQIYIMYNTKIVEKEKIKLIVQKEDKDTKQPLIGAKLTLFDADNKEISTFFTKEESYIIDDIKPGNYILKEIEAPNGYKVAENIEFEITDKDTIKTVTMYDEKEVTYDISISKQDITTKDEIEGATLEISKNGEVITSWISTNEKHIIKGLTPGKYTLTEKMAPDGYVKAESIEFELKEDGSSKTDVVMFDDYTKLNISKQDITNKNELEGAKLQILDKNQNVIEEWISDGKVHQINYLPVGKYTLKEIIAPDDYQVAEDIEFEIRETKEIQTVVMYDKPIEPKTNITYDVYISKQDITTKEEIIGATLQVINTKKEIVDEWVTDKNIHIIKGLTPGKYTLTEKMAPDGYVKAESIEFELKEDGSSKTDIVMFDDYTKLNISKQDITNSKELKDAKLQILDKDQKVVEEWVSDGKVHQINYLPVGKYTLKEIIAPDGYQVAESIEFEVKETKEIQTVIMYDKPTQIEQIITNIQTGDSNNLRWQIILFITCAILLIATILTPIKNKNNKE